MLCFYVITNRNDLLLKRPGHRQYIRQQSQLLPSSIRSGALRASLAMAPKIAPSAAGRVNEPRLLRKQTTEDIAMKACRDNFIKKRMCEEEVFSLKVDDKSLYDDVVDDLRRKRHDFTFVMGSICKRPALPTCRSACRAAPKKNPR